MCKNGEYAKFKSCEKEIKSPCIIYADLESILVPKDNRNQNPEVSYTKNLKNNACIYGYNLECVDGKFSNPLKTCLRKDAVYNFINNMIKESKY